VLKAIPSDTTIPADVLDPKSPLPQIDPKGIVVYPCDKAPKDFVITGRRRRRPPPRPGTSADPDTRWAWCRHGRTARQNP
jgi:hypothetical protein